MTENRKHHTQPGAKILWCGKCSPYGASKQYWNAQKARTFWAKGNKLAILILDRLTIVSLENANESNLEKTIGLLANKEKRKETMTSRDLGAYDDMKIVALIWIEAFQHFWRFGVKMSNIDVRAFDARWIILRFTTFFQNSPLWCPQHTFLPGSASNLCITSQFFHTSWIG